MVFWLHYFKPDWNISRPAVEHLETGERYPIFVLYHEGVSVGVYKAPIDALARINEDDLTCHYLSIVSDSDEPPSVAKQYFPIGINVKGQLMTISSAEHGLSSCNPVAGASPPSEADRAQMADLGVRFDGRFYRYKDYHYDLLADALRYATLDRDSHPYQATTDDAPIWTAPDEPTEEERQVMKELDVTFDGRYYRYSDYRYDRLADAVNYARLKR